MITDHDHDERLSMAFLSLEHAAPMHLGAVLILTARASRRSGRGHPGRGRRGAGCAGLAGGSAAAAAADHPLPSGRFAANTAWTLCAAICYNLLRAAGSLASRFHAKARGATLRKHLIGVPARLAEPQGRPVLHLPEHWPWADAWHALQATGPPRTAQPLTTA